MVMTEQLVGIEDILAAKEARVRKQQGLIEKYNQTLISFTLNIPGNIKFNEDFKKVFDIGYEILTKEMQNQGIDIICTQKEYLFTGCEGFFVVDEKSSVIKKTTIRIEESHYLGRLFDMDVISRKMLACSREQIGAGPRKCLLCEQDARLCGRSRRHSLEELLNEIDRIINYI